MNEFERLLDAVQPPREAGRRCGYSAAHVRLLCRMGRVVARRDTRGWLVVVPSLEKYRDARLSD